MQQSQYQICVLGSANSDHFLEVEDFPKEGETIASKKSYLKNGGKGANQAVASALLKSKIIFAGQIGKDELGQLLVKEMTLAGVDLTALRKVDEQTGQAIILLNKKGENLIIIVAGANGYYETLDVLPQEYQQAIEASDLLQLQMEVPQSINILAAKYMSQNDKITVLDCGGKAEKLKSDFLENLTIVSPNETELERILGEDLNMNADSNVEEFLSKTIHDKVFTRYPDLIVLLKLGSNGSMLVTKEYSVRCQTVTQLNPNILEEYKIVDTVGAGDCFTSAFTVSFYNSLIEYGPARISTLRKIDVETQKKLFYKAMHFGSASAFLCITKHGAMPSMPKFETVDNFIKKYFP
ncbi:unnamed protein product [Paramecium octaurelia]|uniref:Ribokinase n=1 Tax=Paramecium octaurelia TaxID=43137 RepID=A0A8S1UZC9_PAROT|nr:unnamed protein product [Paramecium octaurelia]